MKVSENQRVTNCPIINTKLTRQNDSSPTLGGLAEKKLKLIINIQKRALKMYNEAVCRKYYNKDRLIKFTLSELIRLQVWFTIELEKCGKSI